MRIFVYLLLLSACTTQAALAQSFSAEFSFNANPLEQSVILMEKNEVKNIRAEINKLSAGMIVSALTGEVSEGALAAACVVLSDGEVRSSPLQQIADKYAGLKSATLLAEEVDRQKQILQERRARLTELNREIERTGSELRRQAGLEQVDAMYRRISELNDEIRKLRGEALNKP